MKNIFRFCGALCLVALACASVARAQPQKGGEVSMPKPPALSATDAKESLAKFQHATLLGDFCIQFDLLHRPRRGAEVVYAGIAWSSTNAQGPVTRFRLTTPVSADKTIKPTTWEWLVQDGPAPKVWVLAPGAATARELPVAEWHTPLFAGTVYTPFDLLLPFLYWPEYSDYHTDRILGRGVDIYTMKPPASEASAGPVRIAIDRDLMALVRAEQLDAKGVVVRQFELSSYKNVHGEQDHWMVHTADLLNATTHDADRFQVNRAAMNLKIDAAVFDPAQLAAPASTPPAPAWVDMD